MEYINKEPNENPVQPNSEPFDNYLPIVTGICGVICVCLFIGINIEPDKTSWEAFFKWGSPSSNDIWNGHIWGLITSNFLHVDFIHIVFNLYWLWFLGKIIEFNVSRLFYLFLIFSSAFLASTMQLSFSGTTGIGFSGVVYAMFGFIFIKSKLEDSRKWFLDERTITLFFFWLVFCIILTYTKIWNIGNIAHFSGLAWGILIGYLTIISLKILKIAVPIIVLGLASITVAWSPWSIDWLSYKAYNYHKNQNIEQAKIYYAKILSKDENNEFAKENLKLLEINELGEKAEQFFKDGDIESGKKTVQEILKLDPNDKWANEVLSALP